MDEYLNARTKLDKSAVLSTVLDLVRSQNKGQARFISRKDGRWVEISDDRAREKVGHSMREAIVASDGAEERAEALRRFDSKQNDLLALQRAIFEDLVGQMDARKSDA